MAPLVLSSAIFTAATAAMQRRIWQPDAAILVIHTMLDLHGAFDFEVIFTFLNLGFCTIGSALQRQRIATYFRHRVRAMPETRLLREVLDSPRGVPIPMVAPATAAWVWLRPQGTCNWLNSSPYPLFEEIPGTCIDVFFLKFKEPAIR